MYVCLHRTSTKLVAAAAVLHTLQLRQQLWELCVAHTVRTEYVQRELAAGASAAAGLESQLKVS